MWHHINLLSLSVCLLLSCLLSLPLPQTYVGLCAQRHTHIASAIQIHISIYHTYKLISQVSTEPKVTCCRGAWIHQGCEKVISCPPSFLLQGLSHDVDEQRRCRGEGGGRVRRNKQIYLPVPLSDYFAPAFCSRPYETQMSSEARASYRVLSITTLCAPEALTPDYWLQHKGCLCRQARCLRRFDSQGSLFFFSKEELHLAADAQEIAQERILSVDG